MVGFIVRVHVVNFTRTTNPVIVIINLNLALVKMYRIISYICVLLALIHLIRAKKVLVFGGNGMIGAASVERMLKQGHELTLVSRGNWYWDTEQTIKPRVNHVKCDRMKKLRDCWTDLPEYFDAIVDFSGYDPYMIRDAVNVFKGRVGRYIYISSDSVYEVCEKNHDGLNVETDSVRPTDPKEQEILNKKDDYAHRKLVGEEILVQQRKEGGIPYFFFRLPDVIGSRDTTNRWWVYQAWLRMSPYLDKKITVPKSLVDIPMSLVYVWDVADIVTKSLDCDNELLDEAYNFSFDETPTLPDLLNIMKKYMNREDIKFEINDNEDVFYLFPSVTKGPQACHKAKNKLGFRPTSFEEAARQTVEFYENAMINDLYKEERNSLIKTLETFSPDNVHNVYFGLKKEYGIDISNRDEL